MSRLRVIEGGRPASASDSIEARECSTPDLQEQVERVERDARMAAELVAPGMAIMGKSRADLMRMIATVDLAEAVRTHAVFKEAVSGVDALFEMLRTAELRLALAINAVVREGLAKPDDA
jgi:hypothetical protein